MSTTTEARCDCCDGPDGLGFYHFDTVAQLRRFLDTPDHETHVDIDVADVPGEPYGMVFVTAGEAEAWLDQYVEMMAAVFAAEYGRAPTHDLLA